MEPSDEELLGLMPQQLRDDLATVSRMAAHGAGPDVTPGLFEASLTAGALQFARAALAAEADGPAVPEGREPASVVGEPSDEELLEIARTVDLLMEDGSTGYLDFADVSHLVAAFARAVLARYGHQPAPPAAGEVGPTDEEIDAWIAECADATRHGLLEHYWAFDVEFDYVRDITRAALARWGNYPAQPDSSPAPPVENEVADLVAWMHDEADQYDCIQQAPGTARRLRRAAGLLSQRYPEPVPVSERLPGPEDCDTEGTCWAWHGTAHTWGLFRLDPTVHSHWLPAHALPLPAGEVQP